MSSLVVSTRLETSRARSVAGSLWGNPNLWQVNPLGCDFAFAAQSGNRRFILHVARRGMIVDTHFVPELSAEQRRRGHVENLPRQIPQRHFDAADRADQVVRRPVRARAAQIASAPAHLRVERVNLERIFPDQPLLERQHLLFDTDARGAVGLRDSVNARVRRDLDERIGARRTLQHHHLHVPNLDALALGGRQVVK